ncbi:MAG: hypothetical protein VW338_07980 [Rhodospirillaceae bacterium]
MVQANLDLPNEFDRDIAPAVAFVRACVQGDPNAANLRFQAMDTCATMRAKYPNAAYVFHPSGLVAYINDNEEVATRFWGEGLIDDEGYKLARAALQELLSGDPDWLDVATYLETLQGGEAAVVGHYVSRARADFEAGDLVEADRLLQRASAFKRDRVSKLHSLDNCRTKAEAARADGSLAASYDAVVQKYRHYWGNLDTATVDSSHAAWADLPDRHQLAALTAEAVTRRFAEHDDCFVFEVGCLAGFNLAMARDALAADLRSRIRFSGLEPNAQVAGHGRTLHPWAEIMVGATEDLIAGRVAPPDRIHVCVVSRLFMILHPDDVAACFRFLRGRVETLVICDDIMNIEGERPIIRTPPDFLIMHPFRKLLTENGFRVEKLEMAAVPDRECTGFIVAVRALENP